MAAAPIVQPLSYSIVTISQPANMTASMIASGKMEIQIDFPANAREILLMLFNNPVQTQVAMTPNGLKAILPAPPPNVRLVDIQPPKVQVATPLVSDTANAMATVYKEFMKPNKSLKLAAYGLNYEFEFSLKGVSNAGEYLAGRFIKRNLATGPQWAVSSGEIAFSIKHAEGFQRNVRLQQRVTRPDLFFAHVNNHFNASGDVKAEDAGTWQALLQEEQSKTMTFILDLLGDPSENKA